MQKQKQIAGLLGKSAALGAVALFMAACIMEPYPPPPPPQPVAVAPAPAPGYYPGPYSYYEYPAYPYYVGPSVGFEFGGGGHRWR